MPRPGTGFHRGWAALLLAVQLAAAGVWATLDAARLDGSQAPHVERAGGTNCPPAHDELQCRICQVASSRFNTPSPVQLAAATESGRLLRQLRTDDPRPARSTRGGNPRAPPAPLG